jgi:hypothetical protein
LSEQVPSLGYTVQAMLVLEVMRRLINWQDKHLCLNREDILKRFIDKFKEAKNEDSNNNVYIQRIREMEVREGEGRQSVLKRKTKSSQSIDDRYNECSYS